MRNIGVIIAVCVIGAILQGCFIVTEHKEKYKAAVVLKGLASLMFVILGIMGLMVTREVSMGQKLVIGLVFGLLGDVCLNLRFVFEKAGQKIFLVGILMFLIGHIMYLCALIPVAHNLWTCVIIGAVIAAALLIYIFKTMDVKPAFKAFGVVYLGACIIMTAIAVGIWVGLPTPHNTAYAVGAILFAASDIVLIFNTFSGTTRFSLRITNLSLYYIGQLLIAGSMLM